MNEAEQIFGWADRFSEQVHRADRMRKIRIAIHETEVQCGSCEKWMTPACPAEKHSNKTGRWTGPSTKTIKCGQFEMKNWDKKNIEGLRAELAKLEAESTNHLKGKQA